MDSSPPSSLTHADASARWSTFVGVFVPRRARWGTPGDLARYMDKRTVQTPALELIDDELIEVAEGRNARLILSMPPQEGKSQRVVRRFVLWLLLMNPELRIAVASYEHGMARRWGRAIRNDIAEHPELGLRVRGDTSAAHEWQLDGHEGGVYCVGIGGALTGRPVDILIIDDPVKGPREADSETYREAAWDWWDSVGSTRLSPVPGAVVLVMTRWHEDDLAGRLVVNEPGVWRVINIPAQADHDPEEGEVDPIGREPGEYMISARGRTVTMWENIRNRRGSRTWNALYQGHPSPDAGNVFHRDWWRFYDTQQWTVLDSGAHWAIGFDEVVQSWDMAFKDTDSSDYVCGLVLGRRGFDVYVLDRVHDRLGFIDTLRAVLKLSAKWPQSTAKYVEDKANGPAVVNALRRRIPGLIPIEPDGDKVARARAVSPFVEAGNVHLPDYAMLPWAAELVDECAKFPNDVHDDWVDALSQGLNRTLLNPMLFEDVIVETSDFDEDAFSISSI